MCFFSSAHVQETPQKIFYFEAFFYGRYLYSIYWDFTHSNIEFKPHRLISIKQSLGTVYIILVYVYIAEVQRYIL